MKTTRTRHAACLRNLAWVLTLLVSVTHAKGKDRLTAQAAGEASAVLARIQLFNPTPWSGPVTVEVPVGSVAAPGLIDWANVQLVQDGKEIPFSIREGRVHWKAHLTAPVTTPRAEDLLVFPVASPSNGWIRIDVVSGKPASPSALTCESGSCVVSYPNLKVTVEQATGMLKGLEASGASLLDGPLVVDYYTAAAGTIDRVGWIGAGYDPLTVKLKKTTKLPPAQARLASSSSTPALTELNFVLDPAQGPALALTYRIHASGCVEIWSDERPWPGDTPWTNYAVEHTLRLAGTKEILPYLQNRGPFYGFKDYASVVDLAGTVHHTPKADVLEFGENTINGRRWVRQLYINPQVEAAKTQALVEMVTEGLIVEVTPVTAPLVPASVQVACPADSKAAAELLLKSLKTAGIEAQVRVKTAVGDKDFVIGMTLSDAPAADGLEGDGFSIRSAKEGHGVTILAGTRFGLMQAAYRVADFLRRNPDSQSFPLIASNPAIDLRCGGFGGGGHEVDFPYGTEAEWTRVFDNLIASGMNKMTCLGMWGNWKLPASYKYMPELHSDAPDAYDEVSGAKFKEFDMHRERGQRLIQYLHDRGAQVWLWIPVGCVPTTFAQKYPEAMCAGSQKTPRFMHPKYREYLDAYFKEILETYPLDGFMMVRDDNGGLDDSPEYQKFLETSRTKDRAWEQYLLIYDLLRKKGFNGTVMVYPYYDPYEPRLDSLVPKDLFIGGHGSGIAMLTRNFEVLGPMGDTWLDNLYTSFRVAPMPRMKRLLADRGSYWIGGAYCGTELPWESMGYFGWQPTASVNTFRYDWGMRTFGDRTQAVDFASFSNAYENLWDISNVDLLPYTWQLKMTPARRTQAAESGRTWLGRYRDRLNKLKTFLDAKQVKANDPLFKNRAEPDIALPTASPALASGGGVDGVTNAGSDQQSSLEPDARWLRTVSLYGTFFEYLLRRIELHTQLFDLVTPYKAQIEASTPLPADVRQKVIAVYKELYESAEPFATQTKMTPGDMLRSTEPMTSPYKEWVSGFDGWLEGQIPLRQFTGSMNVSPLQLVAGEPFDLTIELANKGVCPWIPGVGHKLLLEGIFKNLGLPEMTDFTGEWVLPGEKRMITLKGAAPAAADQGELKVSFVSPFYRYQAVVDRKIQMVWK